MYTSVCMRVRIYVPPFFTSTSLSISDDFFYVLMASSPTFIFISCPFVYVSRCNTSLCVL